MNDRRFEKRHPAREEVKLAIAAESGAEPRTGVLLDLSRSGARFRVDSGIAVNTTVRVQIRGNELDGSVKSSKRDRDAFIIGVEFASEYQGDVKLP